MKYVALFRGLNVGGKNIVKMDDLKQLFLSLGLLKVKTYIQSGNVVCESNLDGASLQDAINAAFFERFGFRSSVMLRTIDEMEALIHNLPATASEIAAAEAADPQIEHLYVYFFNHHPERTKIDDISKAYAGPDILRPGKQEAYLLCRQSIRKSQLALRAEKMSDSVTVRNWKTVHKLYELLTSL